MKIAIVTDTWDAINGVVTTLRETKKELENRGHNVLIVDPSQFKSISFYQYPDVKLSLNIWKLFKILNDFCPDALHIATEGPIGLAAKFYARRHRNIGYTTSYHTKFPEYLKIYFKIPVNFTYNYLRWFHQDSHRVLVTSNSMKTELENKKFKNIVTWSRGVDTEIFYPKLKSNNIPVLLCVSRASKEKNLEEFCKLPGRKILVGDGPHLKKLQEQFSNVKFVGYKTGKELASYYQSADVFVFPSKSDTFGVVMIEALACGLPIAAYNVTGPRDIVIDGVNGVLGDDLAESVVRCLKLDQAMIYQTSKKWTWKSATDIFEDNLLKI